MIYLYLLIGILWTFYKYRIKFSDIRAFEEQIENSLLLDTHSIIFCKVAALITAVLFWPVSILLTLTKGKTS